MRFLGPDFQFVAAANATEKNDRRQVRAIRLFAQSGELGRRDFSISHVGTPTAVKEKRLTVHEPSLQLTRIITISAAARAGLVATVLFCGLFR